MCSIIAYRKQQLHKIAYVLPAHSQIQTNLSIISDNFRENVFDDSNIHAMKRINKSQ